MIKSLKNFSDNFPSEVVELFLTISREGFALTLVGGAVRDFFIDQSISKDLDFEIRHKFEFSGDEWLAKISRLGERLSNIYHYEVEELKFSILRIKVGEYEVELSSPRIEKYSSELKTFGHSDFDNEFNSTLSYIQSFRRRDFTLNAIGIEFGVTGDNEEFKLIDPFGGLAHLKLNELQCISEDFYKDPVRFLRLLRFKLSKEFNLSRELKDNIVYFNLDKLSIHYFIQEGKKVGIDKLALEMDFSKRKFAVKLPQWAKHFNKVNSSKESILNLDDFAFYSTKQLSEVELIDLGKNLNIKKQLIKNFITIRNLLDINLEQIKDLVLCSDFQSIQTNDELLLLSKVKTLLTSTPKKYLNSLPENILDFGQNLLNGKSDFLKLSKTVNPKFRSSLGIYCHIRNK
jgi:tRNA nucleotidyltransferase (CCA-adding enzyme)